MLFHAPPRTRRAWLLLFLLLLLLTLPLLKLRFHALLLLLALGEEDQNQHNLPSSLPPATRKRQADGFCIPCFKGRQAHSE